MAYTRGDLVTRINAKIQNRSGLLISTQDLANEAVREVKNEVKIRSSRRRSSLVPGLYGNSFEYAAPADLYANGIIDIAQQAQRQDGEFTLVPVEEFNRTNVRGNMAVQDANGVRTLLVNSSASSSGFALDPLSQVAVLGGSWAAFAGATNLVQNGYDFIQGSGSLYYDLSAASNTQAGISLLSTRTVNLSTYIGGFASVFVNARIVSTVGLTDFRLRLGTDASNYYEFVATARNDGTVFQNGWNMIRFNLQSYTVVGTPNASNILYKAVFMTKTTAKVSEVGYAFNYLMARQGKYADVIYYSKFGWLDATTGAYKENATNDLDILVADTDEFDLFVKKGATLASAEADDPDNTTERNRAAYERAKTAYQVQNIDESQAVITSYYDYGSRGTDLGVLIM